MIKITKTNLWYDFTWEYYNEKMEYCTTCSFKLDPNYISIINNLKRLNLLPENYNKVCCSCHFILSKAGRINCEKCKCRYSVNTTDSTNTYYIILCDICGNVVWREND